jgi:hypothetical protein
MVLSPQFYAGAVTACFHYGPNDIPNKSHQQLYQAGASRRSSRMESKESEFLVSDAHGEVGLLFFRHLIP